MNRHSIRFVVPVGRVLYASVFLTALPGLFSQLTIEHAASRGVPLAPIAVPLAGILSFAGGLSVALGYRARIGAWLLVVFLVPVTLAMHRFWAIADPAAAWVEQASFMKNVSLLGAALLITYFGAGPFSLDATRRGASGGRPVIPRD